tara:strand:+ start:3460 stop:5148 length:1689 start_codon:yes stop_codon:yes gene_type:complete
MGCLGGNSAAKQQNKQVEAQYDYDKKVYNYNWASQEQVDASLADDDPDNDLTLGQEWRAHQHAKQVLANQKYNDAENIKYQNETADQNHAFQVAIQDYEYQTQINAFNKSQEVYGKQLAFNEKEAELAFDAEDKILQEQYLSSAFDNASLLQGLYEATGQSGWDKAFTKIDQASVEGQLEYQQTKQITGLEQAIKRSEFQTANKQLDFVDKAGQAGFSKGMISQELLAQEGQSKYDKFGIGIDVHKAKTGAQHQNDLIRREISDLKAKTAAEVTERSVAALKAAGQAQLGQAGRSRGKIIQEVYAQIGRQNAYTVESLIRGEKVADARMKQNMYNATNTEAKAVVANDKIDLQTMNNIARTGMRIDEVDRGLKISQEKTGLDLDAIRQEVLNNIENTEIEVSEINRNLELSQLKAGAKMQKIDWDLQNYGSRFRQNQAKVMATLDSAVDSSIANKAEIALAHYGADLQADAGRMLEPDLAPDIPGPLALPTPEYVDPMRPDQAPEPIKGAMAQTGGIANAATSVVAGISTGASVAAGLSSVGMTAAAGPIGIAAGIATALFM